MIEVKVGDDRDLHVAWGDAAIVCPYTIYKVYGVHSRGELLSQLKNGQQMRVGD